MFEPHPKPKLFALPPGVDFPRSIVEGLRERFAPHPPEALARVTLFVNTRRMQRRLSSLFDTGKGVLLPRIRLVSNLGIEAAFSNLPPAVSPLRRRLELASLVAQLLDAQPDLAPRAAIYDLADSLAGLMDEMQGEGVTPESLRTLDVSGLSGHWQRSLAFIEVIERFFGKESGEPPDLEARQRMVVERLIATWRDTPPKDPVILAGSTGSRGATQALMQAIAGLPQGAVILPGFDFEMPEQAWQSLSELPIAAEDHPQYRFLRLANALGLSPADVRPWREEAPAEEARNRLVSLALRPAPITDQWREEGPSFAGIDSATEGMTLIEAAAPRAEAMAIALILRDAVENGVEAALVTPDRTLARQVTAALDRWRIEPDDSAGQPLALSAPGRFLRQVAELMGERIDGPGLLALLKHPLTNTGSESRGEHLRHTRDLELDALRDNMPYPNAPLIAHWAEGRADRGAWAHWLGGILDGLAATGIRPLTEHVKHILEIANRLAAGPDGAQSGGLWEKPAGREAQRILEELQREAQHGGDMSPADFRDLFSAVLDRGEVRDPVQPNPLVRIWGTLEARAQGVELVILAGLNEGVWPETPPPDPWLNRAMRQASGLLLPERRIGLSAHDFQQAVAAKRVVLTRAVRNAESETVPSRWVNRLTNLLAGMSPEGSKALEAMRERGRVWLDRTIELERAEPVPAAPRPAPRPPIKARPNRLSVTRISRLVRDPYAIYAEYVLGLRPLGPLRQSPDAPLRGTILHRVMERFVKETPEGEAPVGGRARLLALAEEILEAEAPWPAARVLWLAKLGRVADSFLQDEAERRMRATPLKTEVKGELAFEQLDFTLTGTADRIDQGPSGSLFIYDYKSGRVPSVKQQEKYDKQLFLEAVMARAGAFKGIPPAPVAEVAYIGLGSNPEFKRIIIGEDVIDKTNDEFVALIAAYRTRAQGYTARRIAEKQAFGDDYDHLSRFGEWDHTQPATPQEVGE